MIVGNSCSRSVSYRTYISAKQFFSLSANEGRWPALDTVLPETLVIPSSLPQLLADAQHSAEGTQETLFLQ